jgi:hypothetical protein
MRPGTPAMHRVPRSWPSSAYDERASSSRLHRLALAAPPVELVPVLPPEVPEEVPALLPPLFAELGESTDQIWTRLIEVDRNSPYLIATKLKADH